MLPLTIESQPMNHPHPLQFPFLTTTTAIAGLKWLNLKIVYMRIRTGTEEEDKGEPVVAIKCEIN